MANPLCFIEIFGRQESYELSAGLDPEGNSPSGEILECRVEKRKNSDMPAGVFEIHLTKNKDELGRTWHEKIDPQDVVVIQMMNYQGKSGANGAGEMHTVMIGFVDTVTIGTAVSAKGQPQRVIMVRGRDFGKLLVTGVVTYWTFFGANLLDGKTAATGSLYNLIDASQMTGRPDQIVSRLVNGLFSKFMDIRFTVEQVEHTIFEMLGQQLESYGEFPGALDLQFLNGEGNFWSFFTKVASPPFHELWVDTRRSVDLDVSAAASSPSTTSTLQPPSLTLGKDNSAPVLIMRPTPFPYLRSNGVPNADAWYALRRHHVGSNDLSGEPFDELLSTSDEEQYNFYLVEPKYNVIPDKSWILSVPASIDRTRFKRYGYKPMIPPTSLLQAKDIDSVTDPLGIFYEAMNWRIASWNVLNDTFQSGYKSFKLMPHVHVGDVLVDESSWQEDEKEFYIESIVHHWVYNQRATTTLGLTRGLTTDEYANIGQHLLDQKLEPVPPSKVVDAYKQLLGVR